MSGLSPSLAAYAPLAGANFTGALQRNGSDVQLAPFVSAQQVMTAGGQLTIAHGLGVEPDMVTVELVCQVAELNYTVGQVVPVNVASNFASSVSRGFSIIKNSTNVIVRVGSSGLALIDATTGGSNTITLANWRLVVRALP